jgi:DNA polymerase-3 subunit alpha (Gram-positive type)
MLVQNPTNASINDSEYVIFDIETTGLVNEYDEIIEFGGVKVKNGLITDRIDFFIKPKHEIPFHIMQMTHITQEMVENGYSIVSGLKKIVE